VVKRIVLLDDIADAVVLQVLADEIVRIFVMLDRRQVAAVEVASIARFRVE
jgi:hypothetical protein